MDIEKCYAAMEGDYEDALSRLRNNERIRKYLGMFEGASEFQQLSDAVSSGDWKKAFQVSHTLKGVAQNLGISKLGSSASKLCEMLRSGTPAGDIDTMFEVVKADYAQTIAAIAQLEE